jgi:hypothetical protein
MRLLVSAVLVAAGAVMIGAVDGSVGGIAARTIGAFLIILGAVYALLTVLLSRKRGVSPARIGEDDEITVGPHR